MGLSRLAKRYAALRSQSADSDGLNCAPHRSRPGQLPLTPPKISSAAKRNGHGGAQRHPQILLRHIEAPTAPSPPTT